MSGKVSTKITLILKAFYCKHRSVLQLIRESTVFCSFSVIFNEDTLHATLNLFFILYPEAETPNACLKPLDT